MPKIATLRRLHELPRAELGLLIQAAASLALMSAKLRMRDFRDAYFRSEGTPPPLSASSDAERARRLAWLVDVASRHGPCRGTCLSRSLTLLGILRRKGIGAELRIGARREAGRLQAHAWVEHDGRVLNDRSDVALDFHPFGAIPQLETDRFP